MPWTRVVARKVFALLFYSLFYMMEMFIMIKRCAERTWIFEGIFSSTAFLRGEPHCNGLGEARTFCIFKDFQIKADIALLLANSNWFFSS